MRRNCRGTCHSCLDVDGRKQRPLFYPGEAGLNISASVNADESLPHSYFINEILPTLSKDSPILVLSHGLNLTSGIFETRIECLCLFNLVGFKGGGCKRTIQMSRGPRRPEACQGNHVMQNKASHTTSPDIMVFRISDVHYIM